MTDPPALQRRDALYRLVPPIYRALDEAADPGGRLRAFLAVVGEQVNLLEDDLARWYDNWFIETCDDWVVPYLGDLVGYTSAAAERYDPTNPEVAINKAVAYPRREIADTIALRRRKGTLALLEELSRRIVGWPARAVEYRRFVAGTIGVSTYRPPAVQLRNTRDSTLDVRAGAALGETGTGFDILPRSVDVRRITSRRTPGRYNLPAVALFAARRKVDSVTLAPTTAHTDDSLRWFDVRGIDVPLHIHPRAEPDPNTIAGRKNMPLPLTRAVLRKPGKPDPVGASEEYYGFGKSLAVVVRRGDEAQLVPAKHILVADLGDWRYPLVGVAPTYVAVDPERGRMAFPTDAAPDHVWVTFHQGRPADMGGGEYERGPWGAAATYTVAGDDTLAAMVETVNADPGRLPYVVIEIADNEIHDATFHAVVPPSHTLEVRAANGYRPYLHAADVPTQQIERCQFTGGKGSKLILDGLLFGAGVVGIDGEFAEVVIRHCTFVPGKTRLVIRANETIVRIDQSILGAVHTRKPHGPPPAYREPIRLVTQDSILDGGPPDPTACRSVPSPDFSGTIRAGHARMTAARCTVFGPAAVRAIDAVEDCLFIGPLTAEDPSAGAVRFSYVAPGSVAPPVFHGPPPGLEPRFMSTVYGHPDYARLADDGPDEIAQGAADGGELGVYHDEFFAQRAAHLRMRLEEFVPAGCDAGLIFLT